MARPASLAQAPRAVDPASAVVRLALLERLLSSDDLEECLQNALEWLGEHAGARQVVCALVDPERPRLVGVAGHRVARAQLDAFSVDLDETAHPLVLALGRPGVTVFEGAANSRDGARSGGLSRSGAVTRVPPTPLSGTAYAVAPLPLGESRPERVGLLLASPPSPLLLRELQWLADPLGNKLVRLRDLQALKAGEHRAERERLLLLNIVNAVPDPILLTDTEGRILVSNARADSLFATKEGESEGRRRAVALNNMLFSAALSRQALEDPGAARRELLLVDPSEGSDLLFENLSAMVSHPREGMGIVSILRNVTDLRSATEQFEENYRKLKLAEADVRAERDRLDLIIDSVADPILVTDPGGKILLMNTPAERLFTVPEAGTDESARAVRANDAHFSSFISNLFFTGSGLRWRGEIGLTDPHNGHPLPVEAISGKVLSEHGEVTAVVTILHDRTEALDKARLYERLKQGSEKLEQKVRAATGELVQRNELLQRQHIELEQASQLKSQFLANMSHEFRTPLNAILGYTSMLLQGVSGELLPPVKRNLGRVDSNARHLLSIINDILDISRIEAGKMPLHLDEFELPELISEVLAEVEPLISRARLAVSSELPAGLPSLFSDRQKVKQIVLNLLTNAIKFTHHGSVRVRVACEEDANQVLISVVDTGIGIAEHDRLSVFEDFRQADNSVTREYGGAGLGLSICRRLALMLAGRITLQSTVGQGSTFTLEIPRRVDRR